MRNLLKQVRRFVAVISNHIVHNWKLPLQTYKENNHENCPYYFYERNGAGCPESRYRNGTGIKKIKSIKILTSKIYESDKLEDYIKRIEKEMKISVKVKINNKIHDRYLICGENSWSIGSSIKDLGNKDTIIRELKEITNSLKTLFLERFNEN